jgi:hypothetical protein
MARALSDFYPFLLPFATGCSPGAADIALIESAIEFCRKTHSIQGVVQITTTTAADYAVTAPTGTELSTVLDAWLDEQPLRNVPTEQVLASNAFTGAPAGTPMYLYQKTPYATSVSLYPAPSAGSALVLRASFTPLRTATSLDDALLDKWATPIASGALAYLYAQPNQPYSNLLQVPTMRAQFEAGVSAASNRSSKGAVRSSLQVSQRRFA